MEVGDGQEERGEDLREKGVPGILPLGGEKGEGGWRPTGEREKEEIDGR